MSELTHDRLGFEQEFPGIFYLDVGKPAALQDYLRKNSWLEADESIRSATKAGEGNMNCTLRVQTNRRSFIVKQARPWVEKYAQLAAPRERALFEMRFYRLICEEPILAARMPELLFTDEAACLFGIGDLGAGADFSTVYGDDRFTEKEFEELRAFLSTLHRHFRGRQAEINLTNTALRTFNHGHLFVVPLDPENGLHLDDITPGLESLASTLRRHDDYRCCVEEMARLYLADGDTLIHGDFFPGSFLRTAHGLRVIDPEFCCFGHAEVEMGIFLGHLLLARQSAIEIHRFLENYCVATPLDLDPVLRLAGVEIMRRLIGVAQLPLGYGLPEKAALLNLSQKLVLEPSLGLVTQI